MLKIIGGVAGGIILAVLVIKFGVYLLWAIAGLIAIGIICTIFSEVIVPILNSFIQKDPKSNLIAGASIIAIIVFGLALSVLFINN